MPKRTYCDFFIDDMAVGQDEDDNSHDFVQLSGSPEQAASQGSEWMEEELVPPQPVPKPSSTTSDSKGLHGSKVLSKEFRLCTTKLFLTFPQCDLTVDQMVRNLLKEFPSQMDQWIVCREKHADGSPHLHVAFSLKSKMTIRGSRLMRLSDGKPGHYKSIGRERYDWINVVKYCAGLSESKAGQETDFRTFPQTLIEDVLALERRYHETAKKGRKPNGVSAKALELALGGKTSLEIIRELPTLATSVKNVQNLVALCAEERLWAETKPSDPWLGIRSTHNRPPDHWSQVLCLWFNEQVGVPLLQDRPIRSPQLHLIGPPGSGKTTFLRILERYFRVYTMNGEKDWVDDWTDGRYDICVVDEYNGGRTICFLNKWLDGSTQRIAVKTKSSVIKKQNVPTIVVGNKTMEDIYHKAGESRDVSLEALAGRLCVVVIPPGDKIYEEISFN